MIGSHIARLTVALRRLVALLLATAFVAFAASAAGAADAARMRLFFVVDSSADMNEVFGDASKLTAAENALLSALPADAGKFDIGFLVYGHRISGKASCTSLDPLGATGPFAEGAIRAVFQGLKTKGDAPVASALASVFADKHLDEGPAAVILIAGGPEGCHVDPCEVAGKFAAEHSVPVNVIAIDAGGEAKAMQSLKCIADNTKGNFWRAGSTLELSAALQDALTAIRKQMPQGAGASGPSAGGADTTADPSAPSLPQGKAADAEIAFSALLTDAGPQVTQGLIWSVFVQPAGARSPVKLVSSSREATPTFKLASGDYVINVAYGRAYVTRTIKLAAGQQTAQLVINAGGLKVGARLADGSLAPEALVTCDLFSDQRDQFGNRTKVLSGIKPGVVVRLNSGLYHLAATYGDANAVVGVDVGVEAGKISDAIFTLTGSKVTFKLVQQAGGEALAGTSWTIVGAGGETVKHSLAAIPTHILAAGAYSVVAERAGKKYTQDFAVKPGEAVVVEVVANPE